MFSVSCVSRCIVPSSLPAGCPPSLPLYFCAAFPKYEAVLRSPGYNSRRCAPYQHRPQDRTHCSTLWTSTGELAAKIPFRFLHCLLVLTVDRGREEIERTGEDPAAQAWLQQRLDSSEGTRQVREILPKSLGDRSIGLQWSSKVYHKDDPYELFGYFRK